MFQDTDIIYFSLFRWNNPYSSVSMSFAKEFEKNNRVFYINHPVSYKDLLSGWSSDVEVQDIQWDLLKGGDMHDEREGLKNTVFVTPPLSYPINWMSKGKLYDYFKKKNEQKIKETIRQVIKKHDIKEYIFMNCFDPFFLDILPEEHLPKHNIYQCIDDISENVYTVRHGVRLEAEAAKLADINIVTSRELKNIISEHSPEVHIVHNAADIALFKNAVNNKYEKPKEIAHVTNKIIGFTGNLDNVRVNYPLMKRIAEVHSDKTLLLVGPVNNTEMAEIGLDKMPNVIMTGTKKITELPSYLQYCDCAIIPFLSNKLTKSIYPLKINEYLAAGRSVISSDFSEDILTFGDHITIAYNDDEFVAAVDEAITKNSPKDVEERLALAMTNSWKARVEEFWKIVHDYETKQGISKEQVV